ncbi:MAG TPA: RNA polymerase sigma factor [Enhygromyxa sp.]|nr:RNA polymerase sigma factor [Enhygromyxa sp.]
MSDSENYDDLDDAELVRRTLAGDRRAGSTLLRRYRPDVRRIFQLNLSDRDVIDDLTQDTMLGCFRGLSNLRNPESFRAWLLGIGHNKLKEHYRKKKQQPAHDPLDWDQHSACDVEGPDAPFQEIVSRHDARMLVEALRQLPLRTQQLLLHFYWDKLKRTEIAENLGIPVGTVGSRLNYARKQLQERMRALEGEGQSLHDTTRPIEKWQMQVRDALRDPDSPSPC